MICKMIAFSFAAGMTLAVIHGKPTERAAHDVANASYMMER